MNSPTYRDLGRADRVHKDLQEYHGQVGIADSSVLLGRSAVFNLEVGT